MKKYIWIIPCFFLLLYFGPSMTMPVSQQEALAASTASEIYAAGNFSIRNLDSMLAGYSLGLLGNNPLGLRIGNILVVALMSLLGMFAVKKCTNDTMTGIMATLIFFTTYWNFYTPLSTKNTAWGEFFNVLALGMFFMASRENRFSLQRISLLIFCGFLTALSLIINGISPFFMSFVIAVIFLLWEKKYIDMLLMPVVISAVTVGFLLLHGYYIEKSLWYELIVLGREFVSNLQELSSGGFWWHCMSNLKTLLFGIMPSAVFLICAIVGYKGYVKHFFKQSIYKFTFVFLCVGIISVMFNREVFLADLPLTYLPYSFLVGAGLVNYFRTRNKYLLFNSLLWIFVIAVVYVSLYVLVCDSFTVTRNLAIAGLLWSLFILISFASPKTSSRLKAYFIGLSMGLFASITVLSYNAISREELQSVLSIAVEPGDEDYRIYASKSMYHLVRFYMTDKKITLIEAAKLEKLTPEMEKLREDDDIVIFAKKDEISQELLQKARTVDARKFRLHLFMEKK
ncbi:MAG: hypothetical protein IKB71_08140 [Lentisphaeria bacterium]|nr:hypothetical protein [Lentisphaeria bacterium]